jgi:beta-lactamase class A
MAPGDSALRAEIDRFHLPTGPSARDSTWAEWHYFNILSPDGSYWLYLTYLVGGSLEDEAWGGQILANLVWMDGTERRFEDRFEADDVRFSTDRPDLDLAESSVRLLSDGSYRLSARVPAADGRDDTLSIDLALQPAPRRYLPPVDVSPGGFTSGYVVPVLDGASSGSLCIDGSCRELSDAASYHDHNWGVWRSVTWDWGFARAGDLSILYGGVKRDASGGGRFLFVVDSLGLRGVLPIREIEYEWSEQGVPEGFRLLADRGSDSLAIRATVAHLRTTPREEDGADFHQMRGPADVSGFLLGEPISERGAGFFETWTRDPESAGSLRRAIVDRMANTGAEYGIAFRDPATGAEILINPDAEFHAASMMKVPVMARLYRMADAGRLDLAEPIELRNEFRSIFDGSVYSLTLDEDSDSTLYARAGDSIPTVELIDLMIARSSNLATNVLIELADPDSIAAMLDEFGAGGMKVLRGVEDIPAYRNGMNNTTTARGLLELFDALGSGRAAGPVSTRAMIDILLGQEFNDAIPAGLPADVPVAHKTGWITAVDHDGGLVYPPDGPPYVLVVLTSGVEDESVTREAAADVSRMVWEWRRKVLAADD